MGTTIELTAADGHRFAAYRAEPAGKPRGALVVIQEIFGVNGHIRGVADGFAADGYSAIAPALFDRSERGVDIGYSQPEIDRGRAIMQKIPLDDALKDVAAVDHRRRRRRQGRHRGLLLGRDRSFVAAAKLDGLACAVSYYGGGVAANVNPRAEVPRDVPLRRNRSRNLDGSRRAGPHGAARDRPSTSTRRATDSTASSEAPITRRARSSRGPGRSSSCGATSARYGAHLVFTIRGGTPPRASRPQKNRRQRGDSHFSAWAVTAPSDCSRPQRARRSG